MDNGITEQRDDCGKDGADTSKTPKIKPLVNDDTGSRSGNVSPNLWDSLESDTESLVQEKAYQRELKQRVMDEDNNSGHEFSVNEDCDDLYSRTEIQPPAARICGPPSKNTTLTRQNLLGDEYADLRYDPNWRRNLADAEFLHHVQTSLSLDSCGVPGDITGHTEEAASIGRHEYTVVRNPASAAIDIVHPRPPSSSFHLHPQQSQFSHEDTTLSVQRSSYASSESTPRLKSDRALKTRDRFADHQSAAEILPSTSSRPRQQRDSNKQYDREDQSRASAQEESKDTLNLALPQRRHSRKVKQPRPREDIVERNKATLGMNTHKQGSYLKAYGQKGRTQDESNELPQPSEDTTSIDSQGSPENALDSELMWIQKTQKLKVHKESKRSDGARHQLRKPRHKIHLNLPVERRVSEVGHHPQAFSKNKVHTPSDSGRISHSPGQECLPSASTVNLNINLNTPAKLTVPFLGPEPQEHVYTLVPPQWRIRPDVFSPPFIHPGYAIHQMSSSPQVPVSVLTSGNFHEGRIHPQDTGIRMNGEPILRAHESSTARIASNWPPFKEDPSLNTPEVVVFDEGDSGHALQTCSGGYAVLPPIGRSSRCNEELCSDGTELAPNAIQRSYSDGYLAQLEKQRQLKARMYKAYTLKDYRSLNQEVKLGGLGPSNTVDENMAEKIRRQKLYSNVIREQNKKISRIPFLSDRNPVGSDNKDAIPRKKALEYAKTIAKPKVPQQWRVKPKEKSESENMFEQSAYIQLGVDLSQLAALEMLRKRHEQEKQAVARFTSLHSGSSAPSVHTT